MRTLLLIPFIALSLHIAADPADDQRAIPAAKVIEDYLKLPFPETDVRGEAFTTRYNKLAKLKLYLPREAADAVAKSLPQIKNEHQRGELVAILRDIASPATAAVCVAALSDESAEVRGTALQCLRLYSRKVDKAGPDRRQIGQETKPLIDGLVPQLIKAADDPVPANRTLALYALADTVDPAAVARLRTALTDADDDVRVAAACLLTEFNDASGISELRKELDRLGAAKAKNDPMRFMTAGRLFSSFERITGKSFGHTPMNPMLSSNSRQVVKLEAEYDRLTDAWTDWWNWEPKAKQ